MKIGVLKLLKNFLELFFPRCCCICGKALVEGEKEICLHCLSSLPVALNVDGEKNYVEKRFIGRLPIEAATALLVFEQKNKTQELLHQIKYQGNERLAVLLGRQLGLKLASNPRFQTVDAIIPVPLHRRRERQRGYNQSLLICQGIVKHFQRPLITNNLIRKKYTETQTKKNREERLENMKEVFTVRNSKELENKHILIVDDVITTGATTEACWIAMKSIPGIRVSIASLSVAGND